MWPCQESRSGLLCFLATICIVGVSNVAAQITNEYRLPRNIKPSLYKIDLTLPSDFHETFAFTGKVEITFTPTEALKSITLHAVDITIDKADVSLNVNGNDVEPTKITDKKDKEFMIFDFADDLEKDKVYTLVIKKYVGKLHDDMYGFYASSYENDKNEIEWIATTQFEATYARRAFPCFDEPDLKAEFELSIERPVGYHSLSNTQMKDIPAPGTTEDSEIDKFEKTPKMSTYLLAFIVSKFKQVHVPATGDYMNVWTREEAIQTAQYSYEAGLLILKSLNAYTGIDYLKHNNKMDQVAIPDFAAGAMENWGLVTYRESGLLWDDKESTINYKQKINQIIAHEFAHQWFGNLVTLQWWSYTWLNEGFARLFEYIIVGESNPKWELDKQFVTSHVQVIFTTDALSNTVALSSDAWSPSEISNKFASLSYSKGASIIRMLSYFFKDTDFQEGVKDYLSTKALDNAVPDDLWAALSKHNPNLPENIELKEVMADWTKKAGFPVVNVYLVGKDLFLTQERFLYSKPVTTTEATWIIPITYTTYKEPNFVNLAIEQWLEPNEVNLTIENVFPDTKGWVVVNLQEIGYFRVNYDDILWNELQTALQNKHADIHVINRAQIVDDVLNLARAGIVTYARALDITSYLKKETEYYPWISAFNAFAFLIRRIDPSGYAGETLQTHILALMESLYKEATFAIDTEKLGHVGTLKTVLTLQWACELKQADCLQQATDLFNKYRDSETPVDPNLRSIVYCTGLRQSSKKEDWNFLWEQYKKTKFATEKTTLLTALGCTKDETVLSEYLKQSITDNSGIRKQDASTVFTAVLNGNPEGVNIAFTFLKDNLEKVISYYEGMNALSSVINGIADRLTTQEQVNEFAKFVTDNKDALKDAAHQAESAIENAKNNLVWAETHNQELVSWFKDKYGEGGAPSLTLSFSVFFAALAIFIFNY